MQTVLIDTLVVPAQSNDTFLARMREVQHFIKTLPGFVEGFVYEQRGGEEHYRYLTVAVWEDDQAFASAKEAVAAEDQRQGVHRQELIKQLGITFTRAVYERSPY